MNLYSDHLTDAEFSDYLVEGTLPAVREEHVSTCELCQQELGAFEASVSNYASASLAFGKSRPTQPLIPPSQPLWRLTIAPAAWAVAAAILIAALLPMWHANHHPVGANSYAQSAPAPDAASVIAEDNALMQSVDVALAANDTSPLAEFHISEPLDGHARVATRHKP